MTDQQQIFIDELNRFINQQNKKGLLVDIRNFRYHFKCRFHNCVPGFGDCDLEDYKVIDFAIRDKFNLAKTKTLVIEEGYSEMKKMRTSNKSNFPNKNSFDLLLVFGSYPTYVSKTSELDNFEKKIVERINAQTPQLN